MMIDYICVGLVFAYVTYYGSNLSCMKKETKTD